MRSQTSSQMSEFTPIASLRQVSEDASRRSVYPLIPYQTVSIGRDPLCELSIDAIRYTTVSRRHAEIRPVTTVEADMGARWWLCDLNSSNGTFINEQKLVGCQVLQPGDRIVLGQQGPEYVFELLQGNGLASGVSSQSVFPNPIAEGSRWVRDTQSLRQTAEPNRSIEINDRVTMTQLFPIFSTGLDITRKAYIFPTLVTITAVVAMFLVVGQPSLFNGILAGYLGLAAYYRVYQLCGKSKVWWVLLATGLMTVFLLRSPVFLLFVKVFREVLPGAMPKANEPINVLNIFFGDRKSTRLNSSHSTLSRMPSSA